MEWSPFFVWISNMHKEQMITMIFLKKDNKYILIFQSSFSSFSANTSVRNISLDSYFLSSF